MTGTGAHPNPKSILRSTARGTETVSPGRGCRYWTHCTTCPFRVCVAEELSQAEQTRFAAAYKTVLGYVAERGARG